MTGRGRPSVDCEPRNCPQIEKVFRERIWWFWLLMDEFVKKIWPANVSRNMRYGKVSYFKCCAVLYQLQQALDGNQRATLSCRVDVTFGNKFWYQSLAVLVAPCLEMSPSSAAASLSWLPAHTLHYGGKLSSQTNSSSSFNVVVSHNLPNSVVSNSQIKYPKISIFNISLG
jgi:hypothetical protein